MRPLCRRWVAAAWFGIEPRNVAVRGPQPAAPWSTVTVTGALTSSVRSVSSRSCRGGPNQAIGGAVAAHSQPSPELMLVAGESLCAGVPITGAGVPPPPL